MESLSFGKTINLFKTGSYTKPDASLKVLASSDLGHVSKVHNISGLLELAQNENRIDSIAVIRLSAVVSELNSGRLTSAGMSKNFKMAV